MYDLFNVSLRRIMLLLSKILSGNKKHIPLTCIHRENALFRVYEWTVLDLSRVLFINIFLTKCLTLCLKLSRVVKNFLPPVLNFVPNYPGDLDPTRQHFRLRDEHARIHSNNWQLHGVCWLCAWYVCCS